MRTVRVGDIMRLARRPVRVDPAGTYEEIGIRSFGKGIFHKEPVLGSELGNKRVFEIHPGDLVFNNVFAWEGAVAVAGVSEKGKIGSHRFMTYVVDPSEADVEYLRLFFLSERGLSLLLEASPGSAGRNRTLAINRLQDVRIPLPDAREQRRAALRVSDMVTQLEAIEEQLWPVRSALELSPSIVDEIVRRYTTLTKPLSELVSFVSDIVRPGADPAPAHTFVGLQHIESHTGRRIGSSPIGEEKGRKFRFRPGDILYGYLRPYLNKAWSADLNGLCSVDQYVLRPQDFANAELLAHLLRSRNVLNQANEMTHRLQLPRLRSGLLANISLPDVDSSDRSELLGELKEALSAVTDITDRARRRRHQVKALRTSILNRELVSIS